MSNMIAMETIDKLIAWCEKMRGVSDKQCLELQNILLEFDTDSFIDEAIKHPKLLKYVKTIRDCNKHFGVVSALTEVLTKLRNIKMKEVEKRKGKCESCKHSRWWGEYAMTICEKYDNTSMLEVCVDYEEKAKDIDYQGGGGMKQAIEIVEGMRDACKSHIKDRDPWQDVRAASVVETRIDTLRSVLRALNAALKKGTFEEVLPALRDGKKIRRAYWPKGIYLKVVEDDVLEIDEVDSTNENRWFTASDLLEDDWGVIG